MALAFIGIIIFQLSPSKITNLCARDLPGIEKAIAQIDQALDTVREAAAKDFQKDIQTEIKTQQS